MSKILFLTNIPMIRQHRIDMYVDSIAKAFEIALWDLSGIYGNYDEVQGVERESIKIKTLKELDNRLAKETKKGKIVVITNILLPKLKYIYSIIHYYNIPIVNINKDAFAAWMYNVAAIRQKSMISLKNFIKASLHHYTISRKLIYLYHCKSIKYDFQLSSYNFFPEENRCFIKIHNVKYDESVGSEKLPTIIDGEYLLFLDAALADHPMFANKSNGLNRKEYLKQLNDYFSQLENKYKLPVIISAHPKSNYDVNDFNGRKIIMYKTPVLIQHSKYIISHYTTSLYDVILQNKPFKVLYSKEMVKAACANTVLAGIQVADFVNSEIVNLNNPVLNDFTVDVDKYKRFKFKFLVNKEKMNFTNNELIVSILKKIIEI